MRPLGRNQTAVLRALRQHGSYPGAWVWDNHSGTVRILESLVKRGLVTKTENPITYGGITRVATIYRPTDEA